MVRNRTVMTTLAFVLMAPGPCEMPAPLISDGGPSSDGHAPAQAPLRDVTFLGFDPGEFRGGTRDGVDLNIGPYTAGAGTGLGTAFLQDRFGAGQDLVLACATLVVTAPEAHFSIALVFDDGAGDLLVTLYNPFGTSLGSFSTREHRGETEASGPYRRLRVDIDPESSGVSRLDIASCDGFIHEILLR